MRPVLLRSAGLISAISVSQRRPLPLEEWIVAAGVKDEDVDACIARPHDVDNIVHVDGMACQIVSIVKLGRDRQEVVAAGALNAMPGVEKDGIRTRVEPVGEGGNGSNHFLAIGIKQFDGLESCLP